MQLYSVYQQTRERASKHMYITNGVHSDHERRSTAKVCLCSARNYSTWLAGRDYCMVAGEEGQKKIGDVMVVVCKDAE
jgi:hypothetical protein